MTRLLTLTGAGGCGKTRLALEVARALVGAYPDGVRLVELAPLSEPELLPQAVAGTLSIREQPGRAVTDTLVDALASRELLLVLDNCEHLVEEAARLTKVLLSSCPRLRILATSRELLEVAGEVSHIVPSLSLPEPTTPAIIGEVLESESVRLFVDRARSRQSAFELSEENAEAVGEICRRLDGVPLAVELAAARVGVLTVQQIAARLDDSLGLLTEGDRTSIPRHKTLRATLDWSYALLDGLEKMLFRRLSVFAGGWTLDAAEEIGTSRGIGREEILDLLSRLVHKSLVTVETPIGGTLRYRMLEPIRQYAREKLGEDRETGAILRRHASFYLTLIEDTRPKINGVYRDVWRAYLETEHGNLRAALRWSLEEEEPQTALRLASSMFWFWFHRGYWMEGRAWIKGALALPEAVVPTPARADALAGDGILAWLQGDHDAARLRLEESVALCRQLGYREGLIHPLHFLSMELLGRDDTEAARSLAEESVEIAREAGDGFDLAIVLANLGLAAHTQKDYVTARSVLEECAEICRKIEDNWLLSLPFRHLGYMELREGNYDQATALFKEGLSALRGTDEKWFLARAVETLAIAGAMRGDCVRAARLFGAGKTLREAIGASVQAFYSLDYDRGVAAARARLDETAWEDALAEGGKMTPAEVIDYALSDDSVISGAERPLAHTVKGFSLTSRKHEVALLVSRGMTNRQIAADLRLSESTVANHIASILRKTKLRSRAQIAVWVAERRPLRQASGTQ